MTPLDHGFLVCKVIYGKMFLLTFLSLDCPKHRGFMCESLTYNLLILHVNH
jgi:hypothetical protein